MYAGGRARCSADLVGGWEIAGCDGGVLSVVPLSRHRGLFVWCGLQLGLGCFGGRHHRHAMG